MDLEKRIIAFKEKINVNRCKLRTRARSGVGLPAFGAGPGVAGARFETPGGSPGAHPGQC